MNQKGFAHLAGMLVVAVLAVGAIGVTVYRHNKTNAAAYNFGYGCHSNAQISVGDSGNCVKAAQYWLNKSNCSPQLAIDGSFGPLTQQAAIKYQKIASLPHFGVIGHGTWAKLSPVGSPISIVCDSPNVRAIPNGPGIRYYF